MSLDLSQFHQLFFEESAEHLDTMEQLLVAIEVDAPTDDELNSIFRAAHSIKGAAGTFGFSDLADVTHLLENQLDRLRQHQIALTRLMVDVFLDAVDGLRALLEAHRLGQEPEMGLQAQLCETLRALQHDQISTSTLPIHSGPPIQRLIRARVHSLSEDTFSVLRDDWARHGEILRAEWSADDCVLELATQLDINDLRDLLEFLVPADQLALEDFTADAAGLPAIEEDDGFGLFINSPGAPATTNTLYHEDPDGMAGFFVDLPLQPAPSAVWQEGEGFGFFEPVPVAPSAPLIPEKKRADKVDVPAKGVNSDSSIRVSVEKVDQLVDLVGELVITQAMLAQTADEVTVSESMQFAMTQLERNLRELQEAVMSIRMLPMSFVFSRFPRMVRDVAGRLGKQVELRLLGEHTELDKGLIEQVADPLTHLVRNCVDHGLEMPQERLAVGKPAVGVVTLEAAHQGGSIVITVSDDGRGLQRDKILHKAREKGLSVTETMSDAEVWPLILAPGFSTAETVTDLSGRGVGMDVVKRNVEQMGGRIDISSVAGQGTRMSIRLPLTLAILDGMSVAVGEEVYILPISFIIESLQPQTRDVFSVAGAKQVLNVRNEYLPLIRLHELFGIAPRYQNVEEALLIVLEADGVKVAAQVDALLGQHQVVIKSLETNYRRVPGVSGATIMGDGRVAMILDVPALVRLSQA